MDEQLLETYAVDRSGRGLHAIRIDCASFDKATHVFILRASVLLFVLCFVVQKTWVNRNDLLVLGQQRQVKTNR